MQPVVGDAKTEDRFFSSDCGSLTVRQLTVDHSEDPPPALLVSSEPRRSPRPAALRGRVGSAVSIHIRNDLETNCTAVCLELASGFPLTAWSVCRPGFCALEPAEACLRSTENSSLPADRLRFLDFLLFSKWFSCAVDLLTPLKRPGSVADVFGLLRPYLFAVFRPDCDLDLARPRKQVPLFWSSLDRVAQTEGSVTRCELLRTQVFDVFRPRGDLDLGLRREKVASLLVRLGFEQAGVSGDIAVLAFVFELARTTSGLDCRPPREISRFSSRWVDCGAVDQSVESAAGSAGTAVLAFKLRLPGASSDVDVWTSREVRQFLSRWGSPRAANRLEKAEWPGTASVLAFAFQFPRTTSSNSDEELETTLDVSSCGGMKTVCSFCSDELPLPPSDPRPEPETDSARLPRTSWSAISSTSVFQLRPESSSSSANSPMSSSSAELFSSAFDRLTFRPRRRRFRTGFSTGLRSDGTDIRGDDGWVAGEGGGARVPGTLRSPTISRYPLAGSDGSPESRASDTELCKYLHDQCSVRTHNWNKTETKLK